jgi:hypothetical protein
VRAGRRIRLRGARTQYAFDGFDVLLVVKRKGAPDGVWRRWIDEIITRGAAQVRVLLAD